MNILHIISLNSKISNGPYFSVPGLVDAQDRLEGIHACLLNVTPGLVSDDEGEQYIFSYHILKNFKVVPVFRKRFDLAVIHSYYHKEYIWLYFYLRRHKIPYIVAPRGTFTSGAQRRKRLKKKLGNWLIFNRIQKNAEALHFLTENEKDKSGFLNSKYFIVPNGIKRTQNINPREVKAKNILIMGRYDMYTKGLDLLLEALSMMKDELREKRVIFSFYGSDFPKGGLEAFRKIVYNFQVEDLVKIHSAVFGIQKEEVFARSHIMISPSRFEGLPMAVLEALAYGIPCILSRETNIGESVQKANAGWLVDLDPFAIAVKIRQALSEDLTEKSKQAMRFVRENYSWNKVALQLVKEYRQVLDLKSL